MGLALAGGMGFANADVKVYGQLDMSIDATDQDGGEDDVNMGSNRSAVGFKGSEDLGNGLSAFFKVEYQTDLDDEGFAPGTNEDDTNNTSGSPNGWKSRDQYIGLKQDSFGKLSFGQLSTAYKSPGSKIDPMYRTRVQSRNVGLQSTLHKGKGEEGQGRAINTVRYDTPSWSGFSGTLTYTLDNNKTDGALGDEDDDPYSLGAQYSAGNIFAFVSYITTDGGGDDDATQFGAKYTWGDLAFWGIYEIDGGLITLNQYGSSDVASGGNGNAGSGDGADIWSLGASYTIGNNIISLDYGQGDDADDPAIVSDDYDAWRFAAQHMFSKRTKVYAAYSNTDPNDTGEFEIFTVGMRHNF
jgi:predicted porin